MINRLESSQIQSVHMEAFDAVLAVSYREEA